MLSGRAQEELDALRAAGIRCEVVIVENASLPDTMQTVTTLGELQKLSERQTHGGPALLMIGRVFARATAAQDTVVGDAAVQEALTAAFCA